MILIYWNMIDTNIADRHFDNEDDALVYLRQLPGNADMAMLVNATIPAVVCRFELDFSPELVRPLWVRVR